MTPSFLLLVTLAATPGQGPAHEGLVLLPGECRLSTPESSQRLLLQRKERGELAGQIVDGVEWSSSRPDVATVRGGVVSPVADGEALITARLGGREVSAKV